MARHPVSATAPVGELSLSAGLSTAAFGIAALVAGFAVSDAVLGGDLRWYLATASFLVAGVTAGVGAWHRWRGFSGRGSAHAAGACAVVLTMNSAYHVVATADVLTVNPLLLTVLASGAVLPLVRWLFVVDLVAACAYVGVAATRLTSPGWVQFGVALTIAIGGAHILQLLRSHGQAQLQALTDALAEQATRDQLTGLLNRRGLAAATVDLLAAARGRPLGAVCLDVDGFKRINDELGHSAGDAVLAEIADRLQRLVGEHDVLVRLGGDEFGLLIPGIEAGALERTAHRLRMALCGTVGVLGLPWAVSVGIACGTASDAGEVERLLNRADLAMYGDKQARRASRPSSSEVPAL